MLTTEKKNFPEVVDMSRKISAEDQNIIAIDEIERKIAKHLIHQSLKGVADVA